MTRLGALLGLSLLAACAHSRPSAEDDEARIRARLALWVTQYNSGDYAGAGTIWAPGLVGVSGGGAPDDTFEREQEAAAKKLPPPPSKYALEIDEVIVARDLAVVRDTWVATGPDSATFRSFEVWQRQPDGEWRIIRWIDAPKDR